MDYQKVQFQKFIMFFFFFFFFFWTINKSKWWLLLVSLIGNIKVCLSFALLFLIGFFWLPGIVYYW